MDAVVTRTHWLAESGPEARFARTWSPPAPRASLLVVHGYA